MSQRVMAGLDPAIHVLRNDQKNVDRRSEATPFFERLCPRMANVIAIHRD
jgi:hypothetical protein